MTLARRTPGSPRVRIARSSDPAEAAGSRRRTTAVILRRPYSPSGVIRRLPVTGSMVQASERTRSTTWASVMVRAATGRDGRRHSR